MNTVKNQARWAGFLYFVASIPAPLGLIYIPSKLVVSGNATETAERIRASQTLWRIGIGCELLSQILFIFVVLALYRLFKAVDEKNARMLVVLGALVSVPIMFVNQVAKLMALTVVKAPDYLAVFDKSQLDALAYLFVRFSTLGTTVAEIFWGLWLFPFGALVMRSGFIPRWIGYALMAAGSAYVGDAFFKIVLPQYAGTFGTIAMPLEICELPIIFWLLIWGAREKSRADGAGLEPSLA